MTHYLLLALPLLLAGALLGATDVVPGMNQFAISAYKQEAVGRDNLILSPFSISTALSMLLAGARGQTAAGIAAAIAQSHSSAGYQAAVAALAAELIKQGNTGAHHLALANGLWVQKDLPLEPEFKQTIRDLYQAALTSVDFDHPEQVRGEINSWTAQHTNDRIPSLFPPGSIEPATRLVLTSAIYFYGKWQTPFERQATRLEPFQTGGGHTVAAKFMHRTAGFFYTETPSMQVLEMKYADSPLAFDILLPKATDGLPALERSLNATNISAWFGMLQSRRAEASIPKFKATSGFSLRGMLSRMGMADAFLDTADFSGIDGRRDLSVGDVFHDAFVDVAEEGTEAAAATGITVRPLAMMRHEEPVVFRADHPFAFFIRDTKTGAILFEGRLMEPES